MQGASDVQLSREVWVALTTLGAGIEVKDFQKVAVAGDGSAD